jgi:hypothetical protein
VFRPEPTSEIQHHPNFKEHYTMKTLRGFGWQVHKVGEPVWQTSNGHGWAEKGALPAEWQEIKADSEIDQARIYTSAQQRVRADKRRILDSKEAS